MLSIGKLVAGQERYYQQQVAQGRDDYYSGKGEAPGEWAGEGAADLELSGQVDGEAFSSLLAGENPATGEALRSGRGGGKVAAYDLTFSAPKSVSVLFAIGDRETSVALRDAHEEAVSKALGYIEEEAAFVRRGAGGAERLPVDGLISARYRHRMSRAQDPQLHTHVVTANIAKGADGRYSALDGYTIYKHAKAAGYLYSSHLRSAVRERLSWVSWSEPVKGASEIEGVPKNVLREFSQRRQQIEAWLEEQGGSGRRSAEKAALGSREVKDEQRIDTPTWREDLKVRAAEHGFGRQELEKLVGGQASDVGGEEGEQLEEKLLGGAGLTENRNTFAERDVLIEVAGAHRNGLPAERTRSRSKATLQRAGVREIKGKEARFTTDELLAHEGEIIDSAVRRREEGAPFVADPTVDAALAVAPVTLTPQQAAAVRGVATSGHGLENVEALAGTGKTTLAGSLRQVYESAGVRVVGAGPTARAVRELKERAGIGESFTMARLRMEVQAGYGFGSRPTVMIVDEAGMESTREAAVVFASAEAHGVKVVAIGDSGQLRSVQAGGWFRSVTERHGAHQLTEVMRQRDPVERRLLSRLHGGSPTAYLRHKQHAGELEVHEAAAPAEAKLLSRWAQKQEGFQYGQAVMVARDNATRQRLNDGARELLRDRGQLGEENTYGQRSFAVGDRVIARRNDRLQDLDNGMRGTVRAIGSGGRLVIETDSSGVREISSTYAATDLEHAYALTGHGMQGGTVEWAGVIGAPGAFTRNWSYTALSRGREPTELHLVDDEPERAAERAEIGPDERGGEEQPSVLERTDRMMRVRDDEALALDQLEGTAEHRELEPARGPSQERGAEQLDRRSAAGREEITELRSELGEIEAKLSTYPKVEAKRLDAARAEREQATVQLREGTERLKQLQASGAPAKAIAVERQRISAAQQSGRRALAVERELGPRVPDRKGWERETEPLRLRAKVLKGELSARREAQIEAAVSSPPPPLAYALGKPPADPAKRRVWEQAARKLEGYRFDRGLQSLKPLGDRPTDPKGAKAFDKIRGELDRAQRRIGLVEKAQPAREL